MTQTVSVKGIGVSIIFLVTLSAAFPARGAERSFTIEEAVKFSLKNNGGLKALREEKGVREAGKIRAGLYPNPVFELEGGTGELTGSPDENRLSLGVSQEFLTMGKRAKRLQVADKELETFGRHLDNSIRTVVEEVKTAFYDVVLAGKRVELAERSLALNNQLMEITRQRLEAGDIPELEMNLARVEAARSEGRKIDVERELFPAKARLLALMGLPPHESAKFTGSLEEKTLTQSQGELKALAYARRPDLKALEAELAKSDAEISLAQAESIPNVTAGIGYQRENSAIEVAGSDVKTRDNLLSLKISIPIPVFDRNQAGVREARARKGSAETRYAAARLAAERDVETAYVRLTTAEKSLAIYRNTIIPQLEENLKLVQEAYKLGEVGILTVIEEQKKFFEVNDNYLTALHSRQTALVKLESAIGAAPGIEATEVHNEK